MKKSKQSQNSIFYKKHQKDIWIENVCTPVKFDIRDYYSVGGSPCIVLSSGICNFTIFSLQTGALLSLVTSGELLNDKLWLLHTYCTPSLPGQSLQTNMWLLRLAIRQISAD